jgi:ATP-dependent protease ClpP protease subunit
MPEILSLRGVVGFDFTSASVREQLQAAKGQDVNVEINSPGGDIVDGIDIFNQLKKYEGNVKTHVFGMAASMASYIAMAGKQIQVEDNSIFMIHNAWTMGVGDHRDLRKTADILDSLSGIIARAYVAKSGKSLDEIRTLMDETTYLYGDEIKKAGFADSVDKAGDGAESKGEAVAYVQESFRAMEARFADQKKNNDISQIAALLTECTKEMSAKDVSAANQAAPIMPSEPLPTPEQANQTEPELQAMDFETLEKDHPELFAQAVAVGAEQARKEEKDRIAELWAYVDENKDNPNVLAIVVEAIADGSDEKKIRAKLISAIAAGANNAGENPPSVGTQAAATKLTLSDTDREYVEAFGLSEDEFHKAPEGALVLKI